MAFSSFFSSSRAVLSAAILLRVVFLVYGLFQDAFSPIKYTDIDYYVFTDATRFIAQGQSPYERATYRYTPLLAWLLYPTTWSTTWFSFGKVLFAAGDIVAGWMMFRILSEHQGLSHERAWKYASIWLLNPMVATISTRGSSEGLLGVFVTALLWAILSHQILLAGVLLGFAVHFKIYPFIYAASIVWWLDDKSKSPASTSLISRAMNFFNAQRAGVALFSFLTFMGLNVAMYYVYGWPFLEHSYIYHLVRIDHRHNFSLYNTSLIMKSVSKNYRHVLDIQIDPGDLAFFPQLLLSVVLIPLTLAKKDLSSTMLAQTWAFVTFNKVCTSQYFLWYIMFLPYYLPDSIFMRSPRTGVSLLALWVFGQAAWLQQGFQLEFNGASTFLPGLWLSSILFFVINCLIIGFIIRDIRTRTLPKQVAKPAVTKPQRPTRRHPYFD